MPDVSPKPPRKPRVRGPNETLSYRRRVPKDLIKVIGKTEIVLTLRTSRPERAAAEAHRLEAALDTYFEQLRAGAASGHTPQLHHGRYHDLLPGLVEPGSVDLILTDPPSARSVATRTGHAWDVKEDLAQMWSLLLPVLSPTGTVIMFASQPLTTDLIVSQRRLFRYTAVWVKDSATRHLPQQWRPMKQHEDIIIFARANATYNRVARARRDGRADSAGGGEYHSDIYDRTLEQRSVEGSRRQATTVIKAPRVTRTRHGTEKPIQLLRELILRHSRPGDLIVDPFAGSASVLHAAWLSGRRSVGFEADHVHFEDASARLAGLVGSELQRPVVMNSPDDSAA